MLRRAHLLDEVDDEDGHFGVAVEALRRGEVTDRLEVELGARHALYDGERRERDRVAEHLELQVGRGSEELVSVSSSGRE